MDMKKLLELRDKYENEQSHYIYVSKEASRPDSTDEEFKAFVMNSHKMQKDIEIAEYNFKSYLYSISLQELEEMSMKDLNMLFGIILIYGYDLQLKLFLEIFDRKREEEKEKTP